MRRYTATIKTIAAADTAKKKGRRRESGSVRRKLQAPPGFWAKIRIRCPFTSSRWRTPCPLGLSPLSWLFTHALLTISAMNDSVVRATSSAMDALPRGGVRVGKLGALSGDDEAMPADALGWLVAGDWSGSIDMIGSGWGCEPRR